MSGQRDHGAGLVLGLLRRRQGRPQHRQVNACTVTDARGALKQPFRFAVLADLHDERFDDILPQIQGVDAVLVPGDVLNRYRRGMVYAEGFLQALPEIAPTFLSVGNHDWKSEDGPAFRRLVSRSRVKLLDDGVTVFRRDVVLGGLSSRAEGANPKAARTLAGMKGWRLLMCHHPEDYFDAVRGLPIDLTIAGHAHGGQVRLLSRGLYAPGQGLLPRWTAGFYDDGRLLVSRGLTNTVLVPRLGNPCEILIVTAQPKA